MFKDDYMILLIIKSEDMLKHQNFDSNKHAKVSIFVLYMQIFYFFFFIFKDHRMAGPREFFRYIKRSILQVVHSFWFESCQQFHINLDFLGRKDPGLILI